MKKVNFKLLERLVFLLLLVILFILPFLDGGTSFFAQSLILCMPLPLLLLARATGEVKSQVIPSKVVYFGIAFLFFVFISVFTSVSLALSIPAFFHLLASLLFFYLFLAIASEENLKKGVGVFLATSFLLCLISLYYLLPGVEKPEGMNLVYATFGHSHLSDYLILTIPLVLVLFLHAKKRKLKLLFKGLLIFFLINLVLTFGRGAFLVLPLVSLLFIHLLKPKRADEKIISWSLVLVPLCLLLLILIFSLAPFGTKVKTLFSDNWLIRQLFKPSFHAKRFDYWQQALRGSLARPFFGFGWGTFKLVALRFQKLPASWSDYTHNFYLQVLAEAGVFAFFALFGFLSLSFQKICKLLKKEKKNPIILGSFGAILASALHSLIDFDWNFPAIFLTFLFLMANLLSLALQASKSRGVNKNLPPKAGEPSFSQARNRAQPLRLVERLVVGAAVLCFIFGQMQVMGEYFYQKKNFMKAFFFSPWRKEIVEKTQEAFLGEDFSSQEKIVRLMLFFSGQDPFILTFLADKYYGQDKLEEAAVLYHQAIIASPLEDLRLYPRLGKIYEELGEKKKKEQLGQFFAKNLDQEREFFKNRPQYAKIFYLFGETYLEKEPEKATSWWERAVLAGPEWSYFHIELASLYAKLGKFGEAEKTLSQCLVFHHPREYCQTYLEKFKTQKAVEVPGHFQSQILKEIGD